MKFCDKLIQLRKRSGLSQEELGEKLNVTRQTVSKWELGQTKPETDKMLEISKLFNIDFNLLIDDTKAIKNLVITNHLNNDDLKPRSWLLVLLIIIAIIISIILGSKFITIIGTWYNNNLENRLDDDTLNDSSFMDDFFDNIRENLNDGERDSFNYTYEKHSGTCLGTWVKDTIDDVITNNKTNKEHIIRIVHESTNTVDETEIRNLKKNFDDWTDYEVILDYDENGYVNQITIENLKG